MMLEPDGLLHPQAEAPRIAGKHQALGKPGREPPSRSRRELAPCTPGLGLPASRNARLQPPGAEASRGWLFPPEAPANPFTKVPIQPIRNLE